MKAAPVGAETVYMRRIALLTTLAFALTAGSAGAYPLPGARQCPVFPASSVWNKRVDALPVAGNSSAIVGSIGATLNVHADFGSGLWNGGPIGIPITVVGSSTPKRIVRFDYAEESDRGPYPIPSGVKIEGGRQADGDRHAILVDRSSCRLYELFALYPRSGSLAGAQARAPSGTCVRTGSALPVGRPPTLPGFRSSRG